MARAEFIDEGAADNLFRSYAEECILPLVLCVYAGALKVGSAMAINLSISFLRILLSILS